MFHKEHSDKTNIFVNHIKLDKVDKKKESKTTPHVNTKISAYDRIVQLVTNDRSGVSDPTERGTASFVPEVKPPQEEQKKRVHMSV